jgi:phosphatidylinositol 4-kinase
MGGRDSEMWTYFKVLLWKGFLEVRKYVNDIVYLVEIMREGSDLPCFKAFDLDQFRERFMEYKTDKECMVFVDYLLDRSTENWRTV